MSVHHGGTKGGEIRVLEIVRRDIDVEFVSQGFGSAVHRVVFGSRDGEEVFRIIALQAIDERYAHGCGEKRVLAVRFLAASPARIAKDVDVGRPDSEPEENAVQ